MQEIINFEIGDKSYNLVGYDRELIENSTRIVKQKFDEISSASQSATTLESKFLLVALNLAEDLYLERLKTKNNNLNDDYNRLIKEMEYQLEKALKGETYN